MPIWRLTNHAMQDLGRGRKANWIELANTTANAYNIVFVEDGDFDATNVTVADFIASAAGGESGNYVRTPLTGVAYDITTPASPMLKAANMNIEVSGGTMTTNMCALYQNNPGSSDATWNIVAIANLGAREVSDGSNLVLNDLTPGMIQLDDPNQ